MSKSLEKIKHGNKILDAMPEEEVFFVEDIKRVTGLDDKTLRRVLNSLLKNGYLAKDIHGLWIRPEAA